MSLIADVHYDLAMKYSRKYTIWGGGVKTIPVTFRGGVWGRETPKLPYSL
jgi:hypothetical protein